MGGADVRSRPMAFARTEPLRDELRRAFPDRPFAVAFWDGTVLPAGSGDGDAPTFTVRSPRAVAHLLRAPGQLGLGRAYVAGELEPEDLDDALKVVLNGWEPPPLDARTRARLTLAAVRAAGVQRPPAPPAAEIRPQRALGHSRARAADAVRHHYDISNDFYATFLDASMTYSCAIFSRGAETLEAAQEAKHELVCTKLRLTEGARVLDVGSGWGAFAIHAATRHGARVVGITLSEPQARLARERAQAAGVGDRVVFRVVDVRELDERGFDAIASVGMVEHVGAEQIDAYAARLASLLRPGGRLLNHGIARLRHPDAVPGVFSERYVFPGGDPLHLSRVTLALERAGLEIDRVEGFREDYAETLRHWIERLDADLPRAQRSVGAERLRVWRLYLRAARNGFQTGFTSIFQVEAGRPLR